MENKDNSWTLGSQTTISEMEAEMLQLQQVQTYGKGMLEEEGERYKKMLQMLKNEAYHKRL